MVARPVGDFGDVQYQVLYARPSSKETFSLSDLFHLFGRYSSDFAVQCGHAEVDSAWPIFHRRGG